MIIRQCDDKITRSIWRAAVVAEYVAEYVAVVQLGITLCGRRRNECIELRKF